MPQVRLLVPAMDNDGKMHAPEEVVDVDDELAQSWRASGKASLIEDEERLAAQEGHYSDVVGRDDVGALGAGGTTPGPQQDEPDDEDDDKPKKRRH